MSMSTLKALDTAGLGSYLAEMYGTAPDPVNVLGLQFPNRVGLAAGFDKNGSAIRALSLIHI